MKSHSCELERSDWAKGFIPPLTGCLALVFLAHLLEVFSLGTPELSYDMDSTILTAQVERARKASGSIALIGDSSCLMDVQAKVLSQELGSVVVNLGTLSYLDLNAHASLVEAWLRKEDRTERTKSDREERSVVILMHPEALRRAGISERHAKLLEQILLLKPSKPEGVRESVFAIPTLRDRWLSKSIPQPLNGVYATEFGFCHSLRQILDQNQGSIWDPGKFDPAGIPAYTEYRLAPTLKSKSERLITKLPKGIRLFVGMTPVPRSYAVLERNYEAKAKSRLLEWGAWMSGAVVLTNLPLVMSDSEFASSTHLTKDASVRYSRSLAIELKFDH